VEKAAEPSAALAGADYVIDLGDEFIATVEEEKAAGDSFALAGAGRSAPPRDEFPAAVEREKPAGPSAAAAGADRRIHPRYEFVAAVEVVAAESGARIENARPGLESARLLCGHNNALPLGTVTDIRITKGAQLFEAHARVVYSRAARAWVWCLPTLSRDSLGFLETWLAESREPPGWRPTAEGVSEY